MGLILDTTLFVHAKRAHGSLSGFSRSQLLRTQEDSFVVSTVTLMELAFGQTQTISPKLKAMRQRFILKMQEAFTTVPVTDDIALRAGLLRGSLLEIGLTIGLADTLIAATALELGYGVLTHNVKHFAFIPELHVVAAGGGL